MNGPDFALLRERLRAARIPWRDDAPLAPLTSLRLGGPAALLVEWPADEPAQAALLSALHESGAPARLLGAGSNLLVDDAPWRGMVIRMRTTAEAEFDEGGVTAPAGAHLPKLAAEAGENALAGLEAFAGIPGTVGGAVTMNAGAWGSEVKDLFAWAEVVDREGVRRIGLNAAGFAYRRSVFQRPDRGTPALCVIRRARFILRREHPKRVRERLLDWQRRREAAQPVSARTAGSTWANPPGKRAWELLDACGLRGWGVGGVRLSEKHCNFLINHGGGSADALAVLAEAEKRVRERFGVELEREIRHWPAAADGAAETAS